MRTTQIPLAPTAAVTLPGRNAAAHGLLFGLVVEADEDHHRQVAPACGWSIEEADVLAPWVGSSVGVKVEGDEAGASTQPLGVAFDHAVGQHLSRDSWFSSR